MHDRLQHSLQRYPVGDQRQDVALSGQQPLGAHALGDVLEDEHATHDLALLVADRRGADAHDDRAAVTPDVEHVLVLDDLPAEHRPRQRALVALEALALQRVELVAVVIADLVGQRPVAEDLGRLAVGDDDPARRRLGQHHAGRQLLDRLLQAPLLGAQVGGGLAPQSREVEMGAHPCQQLAA